MTATFIYQVYTIKVFDTTTQRKTADRLLDQMHEVLEIVRVKWDAVAVAFTTDASGEAKKARRLLGQERPNLVTPDCYTHQVSGGAYVRV